MASVVVLESLGAISTILLPSRLKRVSALIRFLPADIVHPVEVGGDEQVGRRALLDLLGQRRARGIGDLGRRLAGVLGPGRSRSRRARSSGWPRRRPPRRPVPGRRPAGTTAASARPSQLRLFNIPASDSGSRYSRLDIALRPELVCSQGEPAQRHQQRSPAARRSAPCARAGRPGRDRDWPSGRGRDRRRSPGQYQAASKTTVASVAPTASSARPR